MGIRRRVILYKTDIEKVLFFGPSDTMELHTHHMIISHVLVVRTFDRQLVRFKPRGSVKRVIQVTSQHVFDVNTGQKPVKTGIAFPITNHTSCRLLLCCDQMMGTQIILGNVWFLVA